MDTAVGSAEFAAELVASTSVVGAVAATSRDGIVDVGTAGLTGPDGTPLRDDAVFRWTSITKPVLAATTLVLVERGVLGLTDPVTRWLPELADRRVLLDPAGELDATSPADRDITVRDLLTSQSGYGFTADFDSPLAQRIATDLAQGYHDPGTTPAPAEWMRRLGALPLAHQPGDSWTYNVSQDILGVLLERATGDDLGTVMRAELLGPIGMRDTGFSVSPEQQHLLADAYRAGEQGIELVDRGADSGWLREPQFRSGAGGLVGTANDWLEFGTMLLAGGVTADGTRLLSPDTVADMMTDHLTPQQRESGAVFLDGQGWGYGGSVDPGSDEPWSSPGRYGWVGASGTVAMVDPAHRTVGVLLTQLETTGEESLEIIQRFWTFCRPPAV